MYVQKVYKYNFLNLSKPFKEHWKLTISLLPEKIHVHQFMEQKQEHISILWP